MNDNLPPSENGSGSTQSNKRPKKHWFLRLLSGTFGLVFAVCASTLLLVLIGLAIAYTRLPELTSLQNYQPKLPLRIFTSEGNLIAEFGEERRSYVPFEEIPKEVKNAILAIEDARFYEHDGVDYTGVARAALANFKKAKSQGASTITMQVARNVYLSSEKTITRKIYEMLLAFKMERTLSKDQILDIYLNHIFLGHRSYGFAAAAETYFGKSIRDVNLAEAAMLAGLPQSPSRNNPISKPKRARIRQLYILERMVTNGFITRAQADAAKSTPLVIKRLRRQHIVHAEYVGEMVRQLVYAQFGAESYSRGLNVYTTINTEKQNAAYKAVRRGVLNFDAKFRYRGPEYYIDLPQDPEQLEVTIQEALVKAPDAGDLLTAVVLQASPKKVVARRSDSEDIVITGSGLRLASWSLSNRAPKDQQIRPGAVIRIEQIKDGWRIRQLPKAESALVALDPRNGSIQALVGGFDFSKNNFNRATQAHRQPGSSFKPFIYSAALEEGIMPSAMVSDNPIMLTAAETGGQVWTPKNYGGRNGPPVTMRAALTRSRNLPSVRILQTVGTQKTQAWVERFGFIPERTPPYLTMALGAGTVSPLELASGYAVFANGGYRVNPYIISLIRDQHGNTITEVSPPVLQENMRVISRRNAFVMDSMLHDVVTRGTGARASAALQRNDLYGKTGTTNSSKDTWFAGFQPTLVTAVWFGYDTPRNLGTGATGGKLSMPIWIDFMRDALKNVPQTPINKVPSGLVKSAGGWEYVEFAGGRGITHIGAFTDASFATDSTDSNLQDGGVNQNTPNAGGSLGPGSPSDDIFYSN